MALALALVLVAAASVLFHVLSPWRATPVASNWGGIDHTLTITLVISAVVFIAINLFIAYAIVRYRHREGSRAAYQPHNRELELWLTGVTTAGIVAMLAPGLVVYFDMVHAPPGAMAFEVLARQWQWAFRFPGQDGRLGVTDIRHVSTDNPFGLSPEDPAGQDDVLVLSGDLHLPLDQPVQVLLRSQDVIHDFYVPQFRVKLDMVPGLVSHFWLTPTRTGRFEIVCSEYCGVGHYNMRGHVVVEEETDFEAWLATQATFAQTLSRRAAEPEDALSKRGQEVAQARGCLACHSVDGSPSVGPTWQGLYGRTETLADGSTAAVDEAYLKESILEPAAKVVKGYAPIMPKVNLGVDEVAALIAYIKSTREQPQAAPQARPTALAAARAG
jgi:cytochrome c oxidase subunit II